jgi:hypothetical protein
MECKGNACLGQNIRTRHHTARYFWKIHLKPMHVSVAYLSAMHNMVRHVRSMLVMVRHVMIMHIRIMHVMVWNVEGMNVWAEVLGQGIIWQGT